MSVPDANGWMTIESAPHDRAVLVWLSDEDFPVKASWRVIEDETGRFEGWWYWEMDCGGDHHTPSRWQDLPKPPVTT